MSASLTDLSDLARLQRHLEAQYPGSTVSKLVVDQQAMTVSFDLLTPLPAPLEFVVLPLPCEKGRA